MGAFADGWNDIIGSLDPRTWSSTGIIDSTGDTPDTVQNPPLPAYSASNSYTITDLINDTLSSAGSLGNLDDAHSYASYLKLVDLQNRYDHNEAELARQENRYLRDTQISSIMDQLASKGVNPILAFSHGLGLSNYGTSAQAHSYTGTAPYSNSARVDSTVIKSIGDFVNSIVHFFGDVVNAQAKAVSRSS